MSALLERDIEARGAAGEIDSDNDEDDPDGIRKAQVGYVSRRDCNDGDAQ